MAKRDRKPSSERNRLIEAAVAALPAKQKETAGKLADVVLGRAPLDDLKLQSADALASLLQEARKAETRKRSSLSVGNFDDDQSLIAISMHNRPFIVDSVLAAIAASNQNIRLILHPLIEREAGGLASVVLVVLSRLDKDAAKSLKSELENTLAQVLSVTDDWQPMLARLGEVVAELRVSPPPVPKEDIRETIQFIEWLTDNNFTFMGLRAYEWQGDRKTGSLNVAKSSGLGILKNPDVSVMTRGGEAVVMTPQIREFLFGENPLIITKANVKSVVHRRTYLDYVGIKRYHADGSLAGELRIVGLFTSTAYTRSVMTIPILRHKAKAVLEEFRADPSGHSGKALINILETWPRDELFQLDAATLAEFAGVAIQLEERPRIRVLPRVDKFDRFVSVIVYVPRERYDSSVRIRVGEHLAKLYKGRVSAWYPNFLENGLSRVHFIIGRDSGKTPEIDRIDLERDVADIVRTWEDRVAASAEEAGIDLPDHQWPVSYQETVEPQAALRDAATIGQLETADDLGLDFHSASPHREESLDADTAKVALKLFHLDESVPLSQRVPMLENLGFRVIEESTFEITRADGRAVYLHDMVLESRFGESLDRAALDKPLEDCLHAVWDGSADDDSFNQLVLAAGLYWKMAAVFRAYARYLRQIRSQFTVDSMAATLARHADITELLATFFVARFELNATGGASGRDTRMEEARAGIQQRLEDVHSSDDDRIIRDILSVMSATMRTNFYQKRLSAGIDGAPEDASPPQPVLAFKIDPQAISIMPKPKPFREIFVSSPRVEGTHLRFGPVARGGLRWSDREQDYRTEVLGLVKAQQVKNAVIVPVGSKGGFFPKKLPTTGDRGVVFEEGRSAYKIYISSLLSVTDNLQGTKVLPPKEIVRHDGDDPYFVVAADKGTATFSDTANGISQAYDFWLDDAFASGGSAGYDHKKMGITARGAWEAVKRHFRELDRDIQNEPFTAAGVGDMSGDVFGNGMLLSKCTRLIAAFDHRDIFIDPDPDIAKSFIERERLFAMDRSSWKDYDESLISKGGGIFARSAKSITLSKQAAEALGTDAGDYTPQQVMSIIMRAPTDLMWFGGIGTYIKASHESDADVGDRGNDPIRVNAREVRAKVIGEGANLGITQKARIEYCQHGGRCNSDAIDNSAGVNSSDVEVNIKIAFAAAMKSGKISRKKRNAKLESMTEEVAELVLRNNYLQTLAISLSQAKAQSELAHQQQLMRQLESRDRLDRAVEDLPDDAEIAERQAAGAALARPETGVLLAYAKIVLLDDLVDSDAPDDPYLERELARYFPQAMRDPFSKEIENHRLRREIIATSLANSMVNRGGPTYISRINNRTGVSAARIAQAYVAVRDAFDLQAVNGAIDNLDTKIPGDLQLKLYGVVQDRVMEQSVWFCRYGDFSNGISSVVEAYGAAYRQLGAKLEKIAPGFLVERIEEDCRRYREHGVPKDLATTLARLPIAGLIPDIALTAQDAKADLDQAAKVFFGVTEAFRVGRIVQAARQIDADDYYDSLALDRALQSLNEARRAIVGQVLSGKGKGAGDLDVWLKGNREQVLRTQSQMRGIMDQDTASVSRLTVAANILADLARG